MKDEASIIVETWMDAWMTTTKLIASPLHLGRFKEPIYFLLDPIAWKPNEEGGPYKEVDAPKGFVTDLASIPQIFWSTLRPDGEYAYAAVIHDYLYWEQTDPRDYADEILRFAMEDLKVAPRDIAKIYNAVRLFGKQAWDENADLKQRGEKRVLAKEPPTAAMTWAEWKTRPNVFA
ncbi:MAG TPA: DUF1353 domain-containing protein [Xanthobacteraceae bacterium]|nr:DUF1353 domain-containing protein [Xanthobacteraceae bacterium]